MSTLGSLGEYTNGPMGHIMAPLIILHYHNIQEYLTDNWEIFWLSSEGDEILNAIREKEDKRFPKSFPVMNILH